MASIPAVRQTKNLGLSDETDPKSTRSIFTRKSNECPGAMHQNSNTREGSHVYTSNSPKWSDVLYYGEEYWLG